MMVAQEEDPGLLAVEAGHFSHLPAHQAAQVCVSVVWRPRWGLLLLSFNNLEERVSLGLELEELDLVLALPC
jgi:hypothetical protein